jgi:hypothetical protein
MIKKRTLKKMLSLFVVCCFLSSVQFSQALALEQQEELKCCASGNPAIEELSQLLAFLDSSNNGVCISEEELENISGPISDLQGFIVIYNILMFIYYGRICLETLDPSACESMATHLVLALFLGILLEDF